MMILNRVIEMRHLWKLARIVYTFFGINDKTNQFNHKFLHFLISDEIEPTPLNAILPKHRNLHRSHQQIFQHQSSVSSITSVQTVYQQNILHSSVSNGVSSPMFSQANSTHSGHNNFANGSGTTAIITTTSANSLTNHALLQQMSHSGVTIGEEALNIGDVADLLHPQYAIITGGRSREGCPIISFPDHNNFHTLSQLDYEKLISYLTSVPP